MSAGETLSYKKQLAPYGVGIRCHLSCCFRYLKKIMNKRCIVNDYEKLFVLFNNFFFHCRGIGIMMFVYQFFLHKFGKTVMRWY